MNNNRLFRRPVSWIVLVILSIVGIIYTYNNFDKANNLVNIEISMDREGALAKAAQLAEKFSIGPTDYKQAASFSSDSHFQNYVELEAGGTDTLKSLLKKDFYSSYYWVVRHFKEQETNEATFWFKPSGESYGFSEKIAEAEKGAALSQEEALRIAEHLAAYNWDIDLSIYNLIEKSKEEQISGRIDHTFVYERPDITIGEGKYRLELVVSGDKLTTVEHLVKIPDEFDRRFEEMRSKNETISSISMAVIALIYGILGVVLGIFVLVRRRMLIWKKPVIWGLAITFGSVFLLTINSLPMSWFGYDTSTSQSNFLIRQLLNGFFGSIAFGAVIALSTMAAEGLGRIAFPKQIQFWKVWSKDVAATKQVLGQTIGGYLFAIIMLAIDVLFYVTTTTQFGWWSPAGALSDPNILANYLPWLDSIAISLQAGFWEEMLFRAVPIAGIFVLTKNKKSRNFWIIVVLILQTLVFGAGHANYPNQPSYARVVEMIIPFTIMGIIYIYYGLLPAIVAHYAVDVFWISLPLWVSSAPGIWLDRFLVILFLLVPVWIILYFYFRNKKLEEAPETVYNAAWEPPEVEEEEQEELVVETKSYNLEKWMIPVGVIGLALWMIFTPFKQDAPELNISRNEAISVAKSAVQEKYDVDFNEWRILTSVNDKVDIKDIFVWREGGKDSYDELLQSYLAPPYWKVRLVKTGGTVEDRAEEFSVLVTIDKKVLSIDHKLPEAQEGANLEQEEAQLLVDSVLITNFGKTRAELKEVSISPQKLDNRTDWEFIYADTVNYTLDKGQGRIMVSIAGDEINNSLKYVHVPEEWVRDYKDVKSKKSIVKTTGRIIVIGIILFGLILGIIRWTKKKFNVKLFIIFTVAIAGIYTLNTLNSWEDVLAGYITQLPFSNFITMVLISIGIMGIFYSLFNGIIIGSSVKNLPLSKKISNKNLIYAIAFGLFVTGLFALVQSFEPKAEPTWLNLNDLNTYIPTISAAISGLPEVIILPVLMMVIFLIIHSVSKSFTRKKIITVLITLLIGLSITAPSNENIIYWLTSGIVTGLLILIIYLFIIRSHFEWIPVSFGILPIMGSLQMIIVNPYTAIIPGGIIFIIASGAIFYFWYNQIINSNVIKG